MFDVFDVFDASKRTICAELPVEMEQYHTILSYHRQRQKYVNNKCLSTRLRWVISLLPTRCFSVDGMQQKIRRAASEWSGDRCLEDISACIQQTNNKCYGEKYKGEVSS